MLIVAMSLLSDLKKYTEKPIVLVLTVTDLYRDMATHEEVLRSMELVDALVVLQPAAPQVIAPRHQHKAHVIY